MDNLGGLNITLSAGALISIPLTIYITVTLWKTYQRVKRIEKMLLHQRYTSPQTGVTYVPEIDTATEDPDVIRIKRLREERQRELDQMEHEGAGKSGSLE